MQSYILLEKKESVRCCNKIEQYFAFFKYRRLISIQLLLIDIHIFVILKDYNCINKIIFVVNIF